MPCAALIDDWGHWPIVGAGAGAGAGAGVGVGVGVGVGADASAAGPEFGRSTASRGNTRRTLALVWAARATQSKPRNAASVAPMRGSSAGVLGAWLAPLARAAAGV